MPEQLVQLAISFAARAHRGQTRKDGTTPYAAHPMRVVYTLRHVFGFADPEILAAGALHDVIEDCPIDRDELAQRFGERVADYVVLLSKDARLPQPRRDEVYYEALADGPWEARAIKLADAYDNLLDSARQRQGPKPKRVKIARHCLQTLVHRDEARLEVAAAALASLLEELDPHGHRTPAHDFRRTDAWPDAGQPPADSDPADGPPAPTPGQSA